MAGSTASKRILGFCAPAAVLALLGLIVPMAPASADNSVFHRGLGNEPRTLDPHRAIGTSASILIYDLFEGLMTVDREGQLTYGAAEAYEVSEDGQTYIFRLRENLRWSDGKPKTAEDFVYSFRRLMDPRTAARYASFLYLIENGRAVNTGQADTDTLGVRALDDRHLEIRLNNPAPFLPDLMAAVAAVAVPAHAIEAHGQQWTRPANFVGSGAYRLTAAVPQTYLLAERNPYHYATDSVRIERVYYYPLENDSASLQRYRAGELDLTLRYPADQARWIERNLPGHLRSSPGLGTGFILLNISRPPFDDPRVRRALSLAIDREGIVARLLDGQVEPAYSLVPPTIENYTPQQASFHSMTMQARMAEARQLMQEAGYSQRTPLRVAMRYDSQDTNNNIVIAVRAMWRAVGADMEMVNSDFGAVIADARSGNYESALYAWFAAFNDASTFLGTLDSTNRSTNFARYANEEFDALMAAASASPDLEERRELMQQAERVAMEDHALIPVFFYAGQRLVNPVVQGWVDNPRAANLTRYLYIER